MVAAFPGDFNGAAALVFFVVIVIAGNEEGAVGEGEVAVKEERVGEGNLAEDTERGEFQAGGKIPKTAKEVTIIVAGSEDVALDRAHSGCEGVSACLAFVEVEGEIELGFPDLLGGEPDAVEGSGGEEFFNLFIGLVLVVIATDEILKA